MFLSVAGDPSSSEPKKVFLSVAGRVVTSSLWNNPDEVPEVEKRPSQFDLYTGLVTDLLS